ncbi:MAG TPA: GntR family transcriptional regulator [Pseudogracilibacillus sp.]|nr:GntR family transcriptional regulator [Pseudogracilibacillus sp.]
MKLPIQLAKDSRQPIYDQIEQQLKALIAGGHIASGTALPSIRVLSKDLEVSVITTRRAYQNLELAGFIETIQGKGTFVKAIDDKTQKETRDQAMENILKEAIRQALQYDSDLDHIKTKLLTILSELEGELK